MPEWLSPLAKLTREAALKWRRDRADVMAAALAYYSVFSLAPLVMLGVAVSSLRHGARQGRRLMLALVGTVVGPRGTDAVRPIVESAVRMRHGGWATAVSLATLVYGASTLFAHLQNAFDHIWEAPARRQGWFLRYLKRRLFSLLLVACVPLVVLAGPAVSAWVAGLDRFRAASSLLVVLAQTGLFAVLFKVLPDVPVPWEDVWAGALFTASLFTVCQALLGFYLNRVAAHSSYGAAGSLVALLVWIHVSTQILLFGAEFVQVCKKSRLAAGSSPWAL
ncbi:MAG: YihY/virulence factor BrkB family protein [Elusimicrobia bacterium]|nr:YihY/virulence factor BrkB family protein [Elusimicrobiota bacterium]MDE2426645.1 YihY/virulence factor BrkB family protein [Elusimicrobiota bacterium]